MPKIAFDKPTILDTVTTVTNIPLSIFYVPLSLMGIFGVMMADYPPQLLFARTLLYIGIGISVSTPVFCIAGICASVILRRKGKKGLAFWIQFVPIVLFALALAFIFGAGLFV